LWTIFELSHDQAGDLIAIFRRQRRSNWRRSAGRGGSSAVVRLLGDTIALLRRYNRNVAQQNFALDYVKVLPELGNALRMEVKRP
jgi:hypothetical protein